MTDAELRVVREWLGLSQEAVSTLLGVQGRTVRRWEAGTHRIPERVRLEVEGWETQTAEAVTAAIDATSLMRDPAIVTYRTDEQCWLAQPQMEPWPAAWHRAIAARVAHEVPGLSLRYPDD